MDKQTCFGIIVGLLGVAVGVAVSAYLMLHPEAASLVLTLSLWASGVLILAGIAITAWPRKPTRSGSGINVKMRDGNKIGRIGNDHG